MEDDEHELQGRVSAAGLLKISSPTLAAIRAADSIAESSARWA